MRPSWGEYFLAGAQWASTRGDCTRRKVGCLIVDPSTHDVIQPGYNGVPSGVLGCLDGGCPRGRHYEVRKYLPSGGATFCAHLHDGEPGMMHGTGCMCKADIKMCACGNDLPCPDMVEPGSSYDTGPGACIATHAEANAIIRAGKLCRGAIMYCTHVPCDGCRKLIYSAGIVEVIWPGGLWNVTGMIPGW